MAIQFARCAYVSRSTGGNACRKASYNQREVVRCERTGELFSFKERGGNVHHEILLPEGADVRFKNSGVLWNEAEKCEKRKDSQVAKEFVIALPDDKQVTLEDRIELTRRFSQIFVGRGVAVQLDVHSPHEGEKNWHAHLLVTTRRFSEDALTFYSKKATDLDPVFRNGVVVEADVWGEIWRDLQNTYFEEKGYDIQVDPIGVLPQEHLGPVRMRHHLNEAILRAQMLQKANEKFALDPLSVLETITHTQAVFSQKDVEIFLQKHVPVNERGGLLEKVMSSSDVLQLYEKDTADITQFFTTAQVRAEEEKLLRFADAIANKPAFGLHPICIEKGLEGKSLNHEQKEAYDLCINSGQNLVIIQGRAGVGKSYVLDSIRSAHEASCFRVLGLAPTHKVAADLKESGFKEAKTCHSFLFAFKNHREKLDSNTLVIVDEAGMLGTELSVELFHVIKSSGAKLILAGDDRQLSSVARGGTFGFLAERYGTAELKDVRRQSIMWQKTVSEDLSKGDIRNAVQLLQENKAIVWSEKKEGSLNALLKSWGKDNFLKPRQTRQILAQRNVDVDALNQGARDILRQQGKIGDVEITCMTQRGMMAFAEGDRIQFTKTDKEQGLRNGYFGIIEHINPKTKMLRVLLDNKELKEVNPNTFDGLRHGYATTVYKAQGSTLDHVYVLHSKRTNQATNYVALTRQTKSLSLYVSQEETPSIAHLIHQMGREERKSTSLMFDTRKDIEKRQEEKPFSAQFKHKAEAFFTGFMDIFHKNTDFYEIEKPKTKSQDLATLSVFKHPEFKSSEGNMLVEKESDGKTVLSQGQPFIDAKLVEHVLKQNMAAFADDIFSSMGEHYHRASSSAIERRYGKKGHIAVNLKTGAWIDYKDSSLSGGPLHLLTKLKGLSFKEAVEYGASWAGLDSHQRTLPSKVSLNLQSEGKENTIKEDQQKIQKAQALWEKGVPIQGTLAERYLREHRKIEGDLPQDLRYLPFFKTRPYESRELGNNVSEKTYPCLMAAARSVEGKITAVQPTFLDPEIAAKATIETPKKSFGILKGSAVALQTSKDSNILFVAEGIETALSIKEAGVRGTIKATLGLSNIKRLETEGQKFSIVVCADHDPPGSPASKSLEKSVQALQEKGFMITVIKPEHIHEDFNDALKRDGPQGVRSILEKKLPEKLRQIIFNEPIASPQIAIQRQSEAHFPKFGVKDKTFAEIATLCEKRLFSVFKSDNGRDPTVEERSDLVPQAHKTAEFIFQSYALKGINPTPEVVKLLSSRAGYEVDRIPELRKELIKEWMDRDDYEKDEGFKAHMMAERLASIEGRLLLEAKQQGLPSPKDLADLARRELNQHIDKTEKLTQDLSQKHDLSEKVALLCANHTLRYKETHGENPSDGQMAKMVQISRELEERKEFLSKDGQSSHEIHYLVRQEGDLLLRDISSHGKIPSSLDLHHIQAQAKESLEKTSQQLAQDLSKIHQRELSL
ncbi:MAG: hypothetical protein BGO67_03115 [Alphaproteobacteria bacterium 41-28]|nr:MAG: hypothetical protein BGO67_03115 [Alphaproteobacteria bacterium 41-28]